MLRKEALKAFLIFKKIQFPEIKGKFTIIMRRRPSEDQGCLLVRHLFYSMSQIPFMVEDGGQRFIRIPGEKVMECLIHQGSAVRVTPVIVFCNR